MSYNRGWDQAPWAYGYGGNGTPMALDIAALQEIYGKNTTFNAGDNTYLLPTANTTGTFWSAIWDVGGTDTIDGSKATGTVFINFNDAELSGEHAGGYVSWQKATGGGFTIANSVVIENAVGGSGSDTLTGNEATNTLTGNGGNDILDGGTGADKMTGGLGNDTYLIDDAGDTLVEAAKGGTDTVKSHLDVDLNIGSYAGQEIENVVLLAGATFATGNALNNVIDDDDDGNTLSGGDGNDTLDGGDGNDALDGGAGNDTMTGGTGNDIYVVDSIGDKVVESLTNATGGTADEVQSSISFSLAALANIDNLTLTGVNAINGIGNALVNHLTGNDNNNTLDGGTGIDFFAGGKGDDLYILDNIAEAANVTELAGQGSDTAKTGAFLLGLITQVENYTYTGALAWTFDASSATGVSHVLIGGSGNDTLTGSDKDDTLNGGLGADKLAGGDGNDIYIVDNINDKITETAGQGSHDLVQSSVTYTLADEVDDLTLTGAAAINGTGNAAHNEITGNSAANVLNGGGGGDLLSGGLGNDTYFVDNAGDLVIETAKGGTDTVNADVGIDIDLDKGINYIGQEIENLTAIKLSGGHTFVGNALANTLTGADGDDKLSGGDGNDILTGNEGNDTLDGGTGNDTMTGGIGNDIYVVDSIGDKVVESLANATGGTADRVESSINFSLAALANIDDLTLTGAALTGTGNALVNHLVGNDNANTLDGGTGIDFFAGGKGDDLYILDNVAEAVNVTEGAGQGSDTAKTGSFLFAGVIAEVENYTYTGALAWTFDAHSATGVSHVLIGGSGVDTLTGSDKDDTLNGGAGADKLFGGAGNDTYVVDNVLDTVDEQGNADVNDSVVINRTVNLQVDFLGTIENATLTGLTALNATGNAAANHLTGNDGNNILSALAGTDFITGGKGDDTLTGGADADTFDYNALADRGTGKEVITDFNVAGGDKLDVHDLLAGLGYGGVDPFTDEFLNFASDGKGNTIVQVDANGGGDGYVTLVTLQGTILNEGDAANLIL
jgi:Ca2+-binding RTX toxin-like protein